MRRGKRHKSGFEEAKRRVPGMFSLGSKSFFPVIKNLLLDKKFESSLWKRIIEEVERIRKEILNTVRTDLVKPRLC